MSQEKHDVVDAAKKPAAQNDNVYQSLSRHDLESLLLTQHNAPAGAPANGHDLSVSDPFSKHGGPLGDIVDNLQLDASVLKTADKGSALYNEALKYLNADEATLKSDVFATERNSSNFDQFAGTMNGYHTDLKEVADVLWGMGLKGQASQTTAYFPLDHYKHEFKEYGGWYGSGTSAGTTGGDGGKGSGTGGDGGNNPGNPGSGNPPGDGGNPPGGSDPTPQPGSGTDLPNGTTIGNLQLQNWKSNTNAGEIGGSGNVQGMTVTPGQIMDYTSQMGAYGDTLCSNNQKFSPDAKNFQFNYQFDPTSNTFKNTQCLEADMVITDKNGQHAVMGSQFNLAEKAPSGMCWFQTWDTVAGKWENAALVPVPKDGQFNNVSMTGHLNGDGTYTYTNLTYDGNSYALQNNTFHMVSSNWGRNEAVLQLQEDARGNGGPVDVKYTDISFEYS